MNIYPATMCIHKTDQHQKASAASDTDGENKATSALEIKEIDLLKRYYREGK